MSAGPSCALKGLALMASLLLPSAQAHDTWFEPVGGAAAPGSATVLALGTGERFPHMQTRISRSGVAWQGCWVAQTSTAAPALLPLKVLGEDSQALVLQAPRGASSCWVQTTPSEIELKASLVAQYLDEIKASAAVRSRWQALQAQGLPWRERFSKDARIELPAEGALPKPRPAEHQALDWLRHSDVPRLGQLLSVQLRLAGRPLGEQAVQAVSGSPDAAQAAFWLQTDAQGQLQLRLPFAGPWLLRTTVLQPDPQRPDAWVSHFSTLRFQVAQAEQVVRASHEPIKP